MGSKIEMVGKKFNSLKVLNESGRSKNGQVLWLCCDCGGTAIVRGDGLRSGATKSCGCVRTERIRKLGKASRKHGHNASGKISPTYTSWANMKNRCLNKDNIQFKDYGGRGISVCYEWLLFENFLRDMGEKLQLKGWIIIKIIMHQIVNGRHLWNKRETEEAPL